MKVLMWLIVVVTGGAMCAIGEGAFGVMEPVRVVTVIGGFLAAVGIWVLFDGVDFGGGER